MTSPKHEILERILGGFGGGKNIKIWIPEMAFPAF
jgi:hypothetical protein